MKKTYEELEELCELQSLKLSILKDQMKIVLQYCNKNIYEFREKKKSKRKRK